MVVFDPGCLSSGGLNVLAKMRWPSKARAGQGQGRPGFALLEQAHW